MPRRSAVQPDDAEMGEINISPMIDMVFILLIFFIVTTVFVEEPGIDVNKPFAVTSDRLEKNSILIAVNGAGQVFYGGREIGQTGVRPIVRRLTAKDPMPVILQCDVTAPGGLVVRVLDEAKLGGAQRVFVSTNTD